MVERPSKEGSAGPGLPEPSPYVVSILSWKRHSVLTSQRPVPVNKLLFALRLRMPFVELVALPVITDISPGGLTGGIAHARSVNDSSRWIGAHDRKGQQQRISFGCILAMGSGTHQEKEYLQGIT
jgi:hypothetical protein